MKRVKVREPRTNIFAYSNSKRVKAYILQLIRLKRDSKSGIRHLGYADKETTMAAALFGVGIVAVGFMLILALLRLRHFAEGNLI